MTRLFLLLVFLAAYNLQAQDSSHVDTYMRDAFFVYPYKLILNTYTDDDEYSAHFKYIQEDDGRVILNENFQGKDSISNHHYHTFDDVFRNIRYTHQSAFSRGENIPPALDPLPDGKYIRYYKNIPYMDLDTLKFIRNRIASIHYLKNNIPEGVAYWFTIDKQVVYKNGNYTHGKREGTWSFYRERNNIINVYRKRDRNNYVFYEDTKKRMPRAPKIKESNLQTTTCETRCTYSNGLKNGIQIQSHSITGLSPYFSIDTTYFLNNKKSGRYCLYVNDSLFTSGAFSIDSSNNSIQSGEWFFYQWKNESQQSRNKQAIKERFLSLHYVINDQKLSGKSPIIRHGFEPIPKTSDYGPSAGFIDGVYSNTACGEIIESEISNSIFDENTFGSFYDINDQKYTYSELGLELSLLELIDSLGYTFKFSAYEEYYDNGQLKIKFKTVNGNLAIENDTVYWENGTPMNIVNYYPERKEYELILLDSSGIEQEATLYDAAGNYLKNILQETPGNCMIDGLSYSPHHGQTYAFGGSVSRDWYRVERNLEDTNQLVSALYDKENECFLEKLFINPQNWNGTIYKELEPNLAFLRATVQFDSLFDYSTYKEVITIGKLKIEYEKADTIDWGWIEQYIKPEITDTTFSPSIYSYGNFSDTKTESVLQYNDVPFSGKLTIHLNAKKQKIRKTQKTFHIYLLNDRTHMDLVKNLVPSFQYYPRLLSKLIFADTNNYKQTTLNFYKISTLNFTYTNGVLQGESTVKNCNNQVLARTHYSNNKKIGKETLYSHFPFSHIYEYAKPTTFFSREGEIDGMEKPILFVSSKSVYKNNLLEGEHITYKSPGIKTSSKHYHLGLQNGEENWYFEDNENAIKWRVNYVNDTLEGSSFTYNSEGKLLEQRNYHKGFQEGVQQEYYPNGKLHSELNYEKNTLNGISRKFHWNGTISQKGFYENGYLKDTLFLYDTIGLLKTILTYNHGCFVSGENYENERLKNSFENSINKFKDGIYSKEDSNNVYIDYRSNLNKHEFRGSPTRANFYYSFVKDSVYYMEYDFRGTIQREGEVYNEKKIGLWKYKLPYSGKYTIHYSDSIVTINDSSQVKSIGLFLQKDENGVLISRKYILNETPLYNCGQKETYDISTYYTVYEKDTNQHLINGFISYLYPNGVKQSEGLNRNGLPTGIWKYYNDNGSLREVGKYKNGKKEGRWLSGDLSKIAYLGDLCIDMEKPTSQKIIENLEKKLLIQETFFEKGIMISQNSFYLE